MSRADVLVVGASPALELTYFVPAAPHAGVLTADSLNVEPGGKATNVARVLHQLGTPALLLTGLDGPVGGALESALAAEGVPLIAVSGAPATRASVVLVGPTYTAPAVIRTDGDSAPAFVDEFLAALEEVFAAHRPRLVVMSGSLPRSLPRDFYGRVINIARRGHAYAYVDATGDALLHAAEAGARVVAPNAVEIAETLDLAGDSPDHLLAGARLLQNRGAATVLVTRGARGVLVVDRSCAWMVEVREVGEVNGAGAGDAFLAGLAAAGWRGENLQAAVAFAARCGAAAVRHPGSGRLPDDWADATEAILSWSEIDG